jgi:hypothetical protein
MARQRRLSLGGQEVLEGLWDRFPDPARHQVILLYARLMARAAGLTATANPQKEKKHDRPTHSHAQQDSPWSS